MDIIKDSNPDYQIQTIHFNSPEYRKALELRKEILRKPLGLDYTPDQLATEFRDTHIIASIENDKVIGNLILTNIDGQSIKMRQVAVDNQYQRKGVGKKMVAFSEKLAKKKTFKFMVLHAREESVPFYISLGYQLIGESFLEIGIPHFKMFKQI